MPWRTKRARPTAAGRATTKDTPTATGRATTKATPRVRPTDLPTGPWLPTAPASMMGSLRAADHGKHLVSYHEIPEDVFEALRAHKNAVEAEP